MGAMFHWIFFCCYYPEISEQQHKKIYNHLNYNLFLNVRRTHWTSSHNIRIIINYKLIQSRKNAKFDG